MKEGIVPPTINLDNPDIEAGCDLDYVPNVAHKYATQDDIPTAILSDNLGFGKLPIRLVIILMLLTIILDVRWSQCSSCFQKVHAKQIDHSN